MTGDPGSKRTPARAAAPRLRVAVVDSIGRPVPAAGLARWLARAVPRSVRGAVTIALVGNTRVRALNRDYRGIDDATDVLSFPAGDHTGAAARAARRHGAVPFLGDIVIATGVSRRQAREEGHELTTELRVLALHGLLHLLGYDHDAPDDGGAMARLERRWRRRGGLEASLIERVHGDEAGHGERSRTASPQSRAGRSRAARVPEEGRRRKNAARRPGEGPRSR